MNILSNQITTDDPALQELWENLLKFELDDPAADFSFSDRLARENGWSTGYTRGVILEYKKFLFLCVAAGHPVCPSEQIDQVWHLHLVYTRSYWEELCGQVLKRPIHHGPTKGGSSEVTKHVEMYQQTIQAYEKYFGMEAPLAYWPVTSVRFGDDVHVKRVNYRRNWIIPKFGPWKTGRRRVSWSWALFPVLFLAIYPWNLKGPEFIKFYLIAAALTVFVCFMIRAIAVMRDSGDYDRNEKLTPYEVAYLTGKEKGLVSAVLIKLIQAGYLKLNGDDNASSFATSKLRKLSVRENLPADADELEQAVHHFINRNPECYVGQVQRGVTATPQLLKRKLIEKKLIRPTQFQSPSYIVSAILLAALLVTGAVKLYIGYQLGKPIGYLSVIMVFLSIILVFFLIPPSHRTSKANQLLDTLRSQHADLKAKVSDDISPVMVSLGFALFGAGILRLGPMDDFRSMFGPESYLPTTHSRSSGSGCSAGCSGGGGCGGGGCGGGGCGGCS